MMYRAWMIPGIYCVFGQRQLLQEVLIDMFAYAEDCEEDVDAKVSTTALLEEYSERREEYGEDDLADVATLKGQSRFTMENALGMRAYLAVKAIVMVLAGDLMGI